VSLILERKGASASLIRKDFSGNLEGSIPEGIFIWRLFGCRIGDHMHIVLLVAKNIFIDTILMKISFLVKTIACV
jgi:hypothetical protein